LENTINTQATEVAEPISRQDAIHTKGFNMGTQYGKIKVGVKTLDDAVINLGSLTKNDKVLANKGAIFRALKDNDIEKLREISNYFYKTSGIYSRVCNYFATMYRYDWYVVPEVYDEKIKEDKIVKDFNKILNYLDNSYIKKICGDIALNVIKDGAYYGYIVPSSKGVIIQELPINYCRSRYSVGGRPAVEFNMKFFDQAFTDINYRMRVLKMFPDEFAKGYVLWKQGKLKPDYRSDSEASWYLLDPNSTIKFSFDNGDIPLFVNAIPSILDLDAAQDLDRRKQMQKLLKIVIQKLPMDKNGDLIFDVDEARDIHNNAVEMLKRAIGVDVLTTFADIDSIDMSDKNTTTTSDDLEKVERTVFNSLGVSQNLFNTDGNLSLEKSILNDEGSVRSLLLQFNMFFDAITQAKSTNKKKYNFRLYMLETTQYNYKDLSKLYKEQVQMGYSKMLPQIALGHSQSSIINTAYFENEVLHLSEVMIPPLMSSTMNLQDLKGNGEQGKNNESGNSKTQKPVEGATSDKKAGRPEKADGQKSEKTIQNKESMS
jgi:hypothetical protein